MKCFIYLLKDKDSIYRYDTAQIIQMRLCRRSLLPISTLMVLKRDGDNPEYAIGTKMENQSWEDSK
jgi:hypothetical protein